MSKMDLSEQIRSIIADAIGVDVRIVTNDLAINDIPEWNSIGNIAILNALEEKLSVEIPMEDLFDLTSVQTIVDEIIRIRQ